MKNLLKSWIQDGAGSKKFLVNDLAHRLSRIINRRLYEVVVEGYIDLHNVDSEQPDIVVYDKTNNLNPALIIELCDNQALDSTIRTIQIIGNLYNVRESFVFNIESEKWLQIAGTQESPLVSSASQLFQIDLNELLHHNRLPKTVA